MSQPIVRSILPLPLDPLGPGPTPDPLGPWNPIPWPLGPWRPTPDLLGPWKPTPDPLGPPPLDLVGQTWYLSFLLHKCTFGLNFSPHESTENIAKFPKISQNFTKFPKISPHDNFFSENIIRDICEKYQLCCRAIPWPPGTLKAYTLTAWEHEGLLLWPLGTLKS